MQVISKLGINNLNVFSRYIGAHERQAGFGNVIITTFGRGDPLLSFLSPMNSPSVQSFESSDLRSVGH